MILIQIAVQITELSTTLSKSLGIDWTAGTATTLSVKYPETLPTATGASKDLFKLGDFNRTSALLATVNALIKQGESARSFQAQARCQERAGGELSCRRRNSYPDINHNFKAGPGRSRNRSGLKNMASA